MWYSVSSLLPALKLCRQLGYLYLQQPKPLNFPLLLFLEVMEDEEMKEGMDCARMTNHARCVKIRPDRKLKRNGIYSDYQCIERIILIMY